MKKLYRSKVDRKIAGIFGGFGELYEIDANLLRLLAILVSFFTAVFPVIITYLIAWVIIPEEEINTASEDSVAKS